MSDSQVESSIPPELDHWNWGAFLLNWIWGIGNKTYIALLTLVPFVGFIMLFVLGVKGSQWAWRNRRWDNVEQFKRVQRTWAKWGLVVWVLSGLALLSASFYIGIFNFLRHSEAYQVGVSKLLNSSVAASILGTPIMVGSPTSGSISVPVTGNSGTASLKFPASGPKGGGTVLLEAIKKDGVWSITGLALQLNGQDTIIDLGSGAPLGTCHRSLLGFAVSCRWYRSRAPSQQRSPDTTAPVQKTRHKAEETSPATRTHGARKRACAHPSLVAIVTTQTPAENEELFPGRTAPTGTGRSGACVQRRSRRPRALAAYSRPRGRALVDHAKPLPAAIKPATSRPRCSSDRPAPRVPEQVA